MLAAELMVVAFFYLSGCLQAATLVSMMRDDGERIPWNLQVALVVLWPALSVALLGSLLLDGVRAVWRWVRR